MPEFRTVKLGDVTDLTWGDTNTTKASFVPEGFVAYSAKGADGFLPYADYDRTGIVISAIGSDCGKTWLARGKWSCIKNTMRFFATDPDVDTEYLYWATKRPDFWPKRGSGQPFISQGDARSCEVTLPPLAEQQAIAGLLGSLNDKIELNRQMNETLEAQARALFRDWFVDFGPVKSKMAGDAPYLAPELWSLFPDGLDDNGVPEGWETRQVRDALSLAYGKSLPARDRRPGKVPVYGSGGVSGTHEKALIGGPAIIVGRKGTVGSIYYEPNASFPIDTVFYVEPILPLLFCFHLLSSYPLGEMNTDAAVPGLNRENVYRLEFPMPPSRLISEFATFATALRDKVDANYAESRTLAEIRDLLLPKLMSGEIRVGGA